MITQKKEIEKSEKKKSQFFIEYETKHMNNINIYNEIVNLLITIYNKAINEKKDKIILIKKYFTNDLCYHNINKLKKFTNDLKNLKIINTDPNFGEILKQHSNDYTNLILALTHIINRNPNIISFIENSIKVSKQLLHIIESIPKPPSFDPKCK